jgi:hypothetical protein
MHDLEKTLIIATAVGIYFGIMQIIVIALNWPRVVDYTFVGADLVCLAVIVDTAIQIDRYRSRIRPVKV